MHIQAKYGLYGEIEDIRSRLFDAELMIGIRVS